MKKCIKKQLNKDGVKTQKASFDYMLPFEVEVGTNGYQGGDWGHGSRAYLKVNGEGAWDVVRPISDHHDGYSGFEIYIGGDEEIESLIRSLKYATKTLEEMTDKSISIAGL